MQRNQNINYRILALLLMSLPVIAGAGPIMQPELGHVSAPVITQNGLKFKNLNRDGKLNAYEDLRLPASLRADDLLNRISLAEKSGLIMHGTAPLSENVICNGQIYDQDTARKMITRAHVNSLLTRLNGNNP